MAPLFVEARKLNEEPKHVSGNRKDNWSVTSVLTFMAALEGLQTGARNQFPQIFCPFVEQFW